jgi:hypothetical protein
MSVCETTVYSLFKRIGRRSELQGSFCFKRARVSMTLFMKEMGHGKPVRWS